MGCNMFVVLCMYQSQEDIEAPMWADLLLESKLITEDK